MKYQKIIFILSILSIIILIFISEITQSNTGTIKSISYSNNKITISLNEINETLILFTNQIVNLKPGDKISYKGRPSEYKNEKQIIVDKIEMV
jgi:DNA/RNA endonuclease YhcR with UshA esterase domain